MVQVNSEWYSAAVTTVFSIRGIVKHLTMIDKGVTPTNSLKNKIHDQLAAQGVAFLFGAGCSYLSGKGYPLTAELWPKIKSSLDRSIRHDIQSKLDQGATGIEHALDLLDDGRPDDFPHRHAVCWAISDHFRSLTPPLDTHRKFLKALYAKQNYVSDIFSLNYDPLLERAAVEESIRIVDGYIGAETAFFDPASFQQRIGHERISWRWKRFEPVRGIINIYKLHYKIPYYLSLHRTHLLMPVLPH